ncbi:C-C motif chemokine 20-like isoform X1 [Acanthopagrus latus]|uniref:C-C motif chemokine 20-like isoform X1 n=1 Tax=Acanthopagrus latus TaxID=8177 RepID=UPI00187C1017|nr:C-C motif chemokine 20-like isoform X1 [Acanthopagrus latus]
MTPRGVMSVAVLLCFVLGLLSPASSAPGSINGRACCTTYNRKPIPFQRIKGYREQTTKENCRIEAIIFYTLRRTEVCATRKDEWVRIILDRLSSKLKKMSKAGPAAGENQMKKTVNPPISDGSGSYFTTTQTFPNSTESFY